MSLETYEEDHLTEWTLIKQQNSIKFKYSSSISSKTIMLFQSFLSQLPDTLFLTNVEVNTNENLICSTSNSSVQTLENIFESELEPFNWDIANKIRTLLCMIEGLTILHFQNHFYGTFTPNFIIYDENLFPFLFPTFELFQFDSQMFRPFLIQQKHNDIKQFWDISFLLFKDDDFILSELKQIYEQWKIHDYNAIDILQYIYSNNFLLNPNDSEQFPIQSFLNEYYVQTFVPFLSKILELTHSISSYISSINSSIDALDEQANNIESQMHESEQHFHSGDFVKIDQKINNLKNQEQSLQEQLNQNQKIVSMLSN